MDVGFAGRLNGFTNSARLAGRTASTVLESATDGQAGAAGGGHGGVGTGDTYLRTAGSHRPTDTNRSTPET
jgi:hypothetical protein